VTTGQIAWTAVYAVALILMFPAYFLDWTWGLPSPQYLQAALMVAAMLAGGIAGLLIETRPKKGRHRR
jgi:hypothetical protein